ncbi:hypothetical protein [Arcobacter cloacae]|uniref:Uncharacterized protein n=1 Tax=Arcobacter cloacae TaxID=1054034 RepID=A0A6M8NIR0_9BACT|nr:hypothetical protein [Arcobacter cloacae]QKF89711.1 hypothetical protein ACLO_1210 [Arcobacter cloacae]RXI40708.1 hypothetical protein CP963_07990 [Arcobacter cloacae]
MFFKLLAAYAPTSQNKASYDEHVTKYAKKLGVDEINIDNGLFAKLYGSFIKEAKSIIISGSAGDGKTYLLRKLYETLNKSISSWNDYIPELDFDKYKIKFIKDFTEIEQVDKENVLDGLYNAIYENSNILYFIAANDGILTDTLRDYLDEKPHFSKLLNNIEEHIEQHTTNDGLILLDLSQTSSSKNFELLLNEILNYCDEYEKNCPSLTNEEIFCPIHSNINLLKEKNIQQQLINVIRTCDLNYNHITLRKLFMLIANTILGYKGDKKIFNSCEEAIEYFKVSNLRTDASIYNNIFGENLPQSKREKSPFKELRELRIGFETTNNIDSFLLFGDIKNENLYNKELDNPFINLNIFKNKKINYLNGSDDESSDSINDIQEFLIFFRRHLFFNLSNQLKLEDIEINRNELIAYKHADKFYNDVVLSLKDGKSPQKSIIKELALGLNRVFLGELISKDANDRLYIATSLTGTMSKLSSEIIDEIVFNKKSSNEGLNLELINGFDDEYCKVNLIIQYGGEDIANLELDLHMFEFLCRISDGILPTSFSVEYYERVLTFKSQIVNHILSEVEVDETFNLFTLNDKEGTLQFNEIEIGNGNVYES